MLFKQPVLHSFNTVCYKPGGAVVSTSEMGEEQVIAFRTHLVSFCRQLRRQGLFPCSLAPFTKGDNQLSAGIYFVGKCRLP